MNISKFKKISLFAILFMFAILTVGCATVPFPNYKGPDGATLAFTMITSGPLAPKLILKRVDEDSVIEILYTSDHDKILISSSREGNLRKVGISRQVAAGKYLLLGAGLGGDDDIIRTSKEFERPIPITIFAHEVTYIGSYGVDFKILPSAARKTNGNVTTVALSGFTLDISVEDKIRSDLEFLSITKPESGAAGIRNATPSIDKN
ncbi:hypothetical protein [Duganella violaceipulchra]|uniref:Uncharacterized protein n=1 Tax=Duganella violaceipulchra TaxID=2849652 RepID=A0AA41HAF3_9BURK|nr:hypothetical protein [Duganella violaceicalia]MBV6322936.1 hypothetical protein [Duganella violaceicalia]MCP2008018.1 hypothetical protein [Duganella violaceicalia]